MEDEKKLQQKIDDLESQLQIAEQSLLSIKKSRMQDESKDKESPLERSNLQDDEVDTLGLTSSFLPLHLEEYTRYSRQLIVPEIGLQGQLRLKSSSALIVGAGGLGCPAAAYLAGAGVSLGVADGDVVDTSNLHRQVLHASCDIGLSKVESIKNYIQRLNPRVKCRVHHGQLTSTNVFKIMRDYDLVLDCTDNPHTRYLISDVAVLLGKPVVSASALRSEGQLMILNHPVGAAGMLGGPCYRCVFPIPPPRETIGTCGEDGIIGPVVGVMGVLQALEAIKILAKGVQISNIDAETNGRVAESDVKQSSSLLMFSAYTNPPFRSVKLRGRRKNCRACSKFADIKYNTLNSDEHLSGFCDFGGSMNILSDSERVQPIMVARGLKTPDACIVVDVREKAHFDVFHLNGSINIPYSDLRSIQDKSLLDYEGLQDKRPIHVICRLGNDSQDAVRKFKAAGLDFQGGRYIGDIIGGWQAWRKQVPGQWPVI